MTGPAPIATVVIVNYNGAHLLPDCLDALDGQRGDAPDFQTVVVDNASTDESLELLAAKYPWVRVVVSPENLGFAGGNNLALREVTTPFAVLLNNDARPEPGWLANLLRTFDGAREDLAVVTGKVVFLPRFVRLSFETAPFRPGRHDGRDLGIRIYAVEVDGVDVAPKVLWEASAYGPEVGAQTFRWTRPSGELLVPLALDKYAHDRLTEDVEVHVSLAAERPKQVVFNGTSYEVSAQTQHVTVTFPAGTPLRNVINNAGGIVLQGGYGADRGFQQIDHGQFDQRQEVFTACGNGMAVRTAVGRRVGWFDDAFFMYYEDTDLSWRIRAGGYRIQYEPTAVLRHVHAASSKEWSPRFIFYVERNRLLMLTKNASARLALSAVLRYPLTAGSMALRAAAQSLKTRTRPAVRPHLLRAQVFTSYLRLLPNLLRQRRRLGSSAHVSRAALEAWLVPPP